MFIHASVVQVLFTDNNAIFSSRYARRSTVFYRSCTGPFSRFSRAPRAPVGWLSSASTRHAPTRQRRGRRRRATNHPGQSRDPGSRSWARRGGGHRQCNGEGQSPADRVELAVRHYCTMTVICTDNGTTTANFCGPPQIFYRHRIFSKIFLRCERP